MLVGPCAAGSEAMRCDATCLLVWYGMGMGMGMDGFGVVVKGRGGEGDVRMGWDGMLVQKMARTCHRNGHVRVAINQQKEKNGDGGGGRKNEEKLAKWRFFSEMDIMGYNISLTLLSLATLFGASKKIYEYRSSLFLSSLPRSKRDHLGHHHISGYRTQTHTSASPACSFPSLPFPDQPHVSPKDRTPPLTLSLLWLNETKQKKGNKSNFKKQF